MKTTTFAGGLALLFSGQWPATVLAGHPLLTEDTGTQGAGRYQLELTHDLSIKQDVGAKIRAQSINGVFSVGLTDDLDVIIALPHERLSERMGATKTTAAGYADMEIAAKWRFYEKGALSFALRPGLGLPTGNEDKGLSSGHVTPSLFAVTTYTSDPWAFHLHFGYTRNLHPGPDERSHIYHASVAAEYSVSEWLRLMSDVSIERNAEQSGHPSAGSMVIGLVYSLTPDLDFDLGYRKGLTEPAPDHAWLTGLALRF
ncbi:MAG: transporter [Thiobacillus sp.]|nr:transporter [Thiobacillus sp.]